MQTTNGNGTKPTHPGQWSITETISALSRQLPQELLETKTLKGNKIDYLPWHTATKILDKYAPGWMWEIHRIETTADRIFVVGRLTLQTSEGVIWRDATGTETLKELDKNGNERELAYGDPSSNAESMAFRRAAAKFGLALYLYDK